MSNRLKYENLDLSTLPELTSLLRPTELEFSPRTANKEIPALRRRLYILNHDNAAGWRYRTLRDGNLLLIWRLA